MHLSKALYPINWIQWLTILLVAVMAVTVPLTLVRISSVAAQNQQAIRSIMCFSEYRSQHVHARGVTPAQRRQAVRFYNQALERAGLKPCTAADLHP